METNDLITWAMTIGTAVFALVVLGSLALPFVLKPFAEYRREGHEQRIAEYKAAERAALAEREAAAVRPRDASGA